MKTNGHGHVTPNADGSCARCGGPPMCKVCMAELAQLQAQSAPEPVQGEAVEVVATVSVSFDEGDDGAAIEMVELHELLDEGNTDLMTVAQHNRIMAAAGAKQASDDRNWLKAKQHRAALKEENAALRAQLSASAATKPDAELVACLKFARTTMAVVADNANLRGVEYRSLIAEIKRIDAKLAELQSCSPAE